MSRPQVSHFDRQSPGRRPTAAEAKRTPQLGRRDFLATSGALAASAWLAPGVSAEDPARPLRLGIVGVANRASANLSAVSSQSIEALCDVDANHLKGVTGKYPNARVYTDYREMLEQEKDLDGVVVSTPDHHHAPATIRAIQKGFNVYCEKPLTHTVAEARAITEAARAQGVVTQMGTQIHAGDNYRRVVEAIRGGAVGSVQRVHVWVGKGWGATSMPQPSGKPAPEHLDWDLWLGPAEARGYTPGLHPAAWRRYRDFGAGTLGDMGCHYIDLPFWALGLKYPSRIVADGPPASEEYCPTGLRVDYTFEATDQHDQLELSWYDGDRSPQELEGVKVPGSGVLFVGDKGMMIATYGNYTLLPKEKFAEYQPPEQTIAASIGHHNEWLQAIRTGGETLCKFDYSGPLTETVLLGTVAHRAGRPLRWNGAAARFVDDAAADAMLTKSYRRGWEVPGATASSVS